MKCFVLNKMKQTKRIPSAAEEQLRKECRNMEAALQSAGYSIKQIQSIKENGFIQLSLFCNERGTLAINPIDELRARRP